MFCRILMTVVALCLVRDVLADETKNVPLDECPADWQSSTKQLGECSLTDVSFRNGCNVAIDVKICLGTTLRSDGWNCGAAMNIEANAGWHWSTCSATGEKKVWVKRAHDYKHSFPKFP